MEASNSLDKKGELRKKIEESGLEENDKEFWRSVLPSFPDDLISAIFDMLAQFPSELPWLTQIYQRKQKAFRILKGNEYEGKKLLGEIYEEEKEKLEQLASK